MIETGKREQISPRTATALAEVFGVSIDWLLTGSGKQPKGPSVRRAVAAAVARKSGSVARAA